MEIHTNQNCYFAHQIPLSNELMKTKTLKQWSSWSIELQPSSLDMSWSVDAQTQGKYQKKEKKKDT